MNIFRRMGLRLSMSFEKPPFKLLTPTDYAEDVQAYEEAMDFALSSDHKYVRNIAVTGMYGAGKTSFLETYFRTRKIDVVKVSLATFLEKKEIEPDSKQETQLELSILQQMFNMRGGSEAWSWWFLVCLALIGASYVCIFRPEWLLGRLPVCVSNVVESTFLFWLSPFVAIALLVGMMQRGLCWIRNLGIRAVNVHSAGIGSVEVEMPDRSLISVLNQNIIALTNFFAKSKVSVVIIEDIDRFNDVTIFTKLREVNQLLNNSRMIADRQKPIRFIYALREDIFQDADTRVKFFDFMIPIIPRVNASNSRTELLSFLKDCSDDGKVNNSLETMVKDVAPYITDLRLLKNICNEYYTYSLQIPDCTSQEELLAIVIFKNFFPRDFALLHKDDGIMWRLIQAKQNVRDEQIKKHEKSIASLNAEIEVIEAERLTDVTHLQALYYVALMKEFSSRDQIIVNGDWHYPADIIHMQDWFELLRNSELCYGYSQRSINWSKIEERVDPQCSYEEHKRRIEARNNGRIDKIRAEIQGVKKVCLEIRKKSIRDLISEGSLTEEIINTHVFDNQVNRKDSELFNILVRNGYLNENYRYNISIFKAVEGVCAVEDYIFEVDVAKGGETDWDFHLKRPAQVVEDLDLKCFASVAVLNYEICSQLLRTPKSEKSIEFFRMVATTGRHGYEFVDGFLKVCKTSGDKCGLLHEVFNVNRNYLVELVSFSSKGEGLPREVVERQLGYYISWVLRSGTSVSIVPEVQKFIEETANIADILKSHDIVKPEDQIAFVKKFGVKFNVLDFKTAKTSGLLDVIVSLDAYAMNGDMLKGVLSGSGEVVEDFDRRSWTIISTSKVQALVEYVRSEFAEYLRQVYLKQSQIQEDAEDVVLSILNRDDVADADKKLFLSKQWRKSRITSAKAIVTPEALKFCVDNDWILPSWSNAVEIWNRSKDDRTPFWVYVGRQECYKELSQKGSCKIEWKEGERWAKSFAENKELSDDAVVALLAGMRKGVITTYDGMNATQDRVQRLVKIGRIQYSQKLFQQLKAIDNDSHIVFAALLVKDFCEEFDADQIDSGDAIKLLRSECLNRRNVPLLVNTLRRFIMTNGNVATAAAYLLNDGNYCGVDEGVLDATLSSLTPESFQCKVIQHLGGESQDVRERLCRMKEPYSRLGKLGNRPELRYWEGRDAFLEFLTKIGVVSSVEHLKEGRIQVNTTKS